MLYFLGLIILLSFTFGAISLAPFVPTFGKDLDRIDRICNLKAGNKFIEVGCGTARVSYYIAKNNPEVDVIGIEINFFLYLYAEIKSFFGPKNLKIKFANAMKYNYSDADIVYIFGMPDTVSSKIKEKIYNDIKVGVKYISYVFEVKGWKGKCTFDKEKDTDNKIYVCIKK